MTPRPIDVCSDLPPRAQLRVRMERVAHITALEVSLARAVEILDRLGFDPRAGQGTIDVRVPTTRFLDVTREIDVIEEIARIYGLEHVPSLLSVGSGGGLTAPQRVRRAVADACLGAGLTEAQTLSYVPADTPDRLGLAADDPRRAMLAVANPLSQDHSHLRTLLLPSLLEALARNAAWGRDDLALFEIAHTYHPVEGQKLPREPWTFGAVMRGRLGGAAWRRAGEPASFFLGKGVLESILGARGRDLPRRRNAADPRPVPAPGPQGLRAGARRAGARLRRRAPPADGPALRLRRPRRVHRARPRPAVRAARATRRWRCRCRSSRRCARTSRSSCPTSIPQARCWPRRAPPAASCSATCRCSTSGATPRRSAQAGARSRSG